MTALMPPSTLVADNTGFGLALMKLLAQAPRNLFFSPYSISTALAMTYGGARNETAAEMATALRFSLPPDRLHPAFEALDAAVRAASGTGCRLVTANRLWIERSRPIVEGFSELVQRHYRAGLEPLDFTGDPAAARARINAWVDHETRGKIRELIPERALGPLTRLVLTNAIDFKGDWATQFEPHRTVASAFHLENGSVVTAPLMQRTSAYGYAERGGVQVLDLPYVGGRLSLAVVLPPRGTTTTALLRGLDAEASSNLLHAASGSRRQVAVTFPRFRIEAGYDLVPLLRHLVMRKAFDAREADFSGISTGDELMIGHVIHKAFVTVDETGSEASAATAVSMIPRGGPPPAPLEFRADRPFLFFIRERVTKTVLFAGRLAAPTP